MKKDISIMRTQRRFIYTRPLLLALVLFLAATSAHAQSVQILATYGTSAPDGSEPPIGLGGTVNPAIQLWLFGGDRVSPGGTACEAGASGDEVCGVTLEVVASGGLLLSDFAGNGEYDQSGSGLGFVSSLEPGNQVLRLNGFDLGTPQPIFRWLGTLATNTANVTPAASLVVSGRAVGANLEVRMVEAQTIATPEPDGLSLIAVGTLVLFGLSSAASRRQRIA